MDKRRQELNNIRDYIQNTDKELTLLLQNLQWDHKHIEEKPTLSRCSIDPSHRISESSRKVHEDDCFLTIHGYTKDEEFLPDPVDINTNTVVKLSSQDIQNIINAAAYSDPLFKRGKGSHGSEPLTVERLQATYTADERRVIHDAVVNAAPFAHDLADLALGSNSQQDGTKSKSRAEVMAELRDMRRRRTKYRVPSKTTNYSHVLKDVIKSQMELYAEINGFFIKTEYGSKSYVSLSDNQSLSNRNNMAPKVVIKQERITPEPENTQCSDQTYTQDKDCTTSRDRERYARTRHEQERDARYNDLSRRRYRVEIQHERKSREYRNDANERYDSYKERRNEKYQRSKIQESCKHDRNDYPRSSRDGRDRERFERSKKQSSSRYHRDDRYNKNYQTVRVKEEKDDYKEHSSSRCHRVDRYVKDYQTVRVKEEKDDDYYEERKKRKYH